MSIDLEVLAVKRVTQTLGANVKIKKFGNKIVFWKKDKV